MLGRQVLLKYDESIELSTNQGKAATLQVKTAAPQTVRQFLHFNDPPWAEKREEYDTRSSPPPTTPATAAVADTVTHAIRLPVTRTVSRQWEASPNGMQAILSRLRGQVKNALISSSST